MSESRFEAVSMLVDNYQVTDAHLTRMSKEPKLSDTWAHYHLIGDVLRGEMPETVQLDLSARIASAIADEPAILAPQAKTSSSVAQLKAKVLQFAKPFGQMAIAASAAGLMILGVQHTNVADNNAAMPRQVVQTVPLGGVADPVSYDVEQTDRAAQQQAYIMQQRRFQALLADHQQQIKLNSSVAAVKTDKAKEKHTPK